MPTTGSFDDDGATHSVIVLTPIGGQTSTPSVRDLYPVFRRETKTTDVQVQKFAKNDGDLLLRPGVGDSRVGEPIYKETRLIYGTPDRGVYAVPTTGQAICLGHFPNGGAGCSSPGPHGVTMDWEDASNGAPWILYGMAGDDVTGIDAVVAGVVHQVDVRESAYVLELPHAGRAPLQKIVLHLDNGETDELPVPGS